MKNHLAKDMINPRIEHIQSELDRLAFECNSVDIFVHQVKILADRCHGTAHRYVQGNHHLDELIILYSYVYQHMNYLLEDNRLAAMNALVVSSNRLINQVIEIKNDPETDELACPAYLLDMALNTFTMTRDKLQNELLDRVI